MYVISKSCNTGIAVNCADLCVSDPCRLYSMMLLHCVILVMLADKKMTLMAVNKYVNLCVSTYL